MKNKQDDFFDIEPKEFYEFACEFDEIKHDLISIVFHLTGNKIRHGNFTAFL